MKHAKSTDNHLLKGWLIGAIIELILRAFTGFFIKKPSGIYVGMMLRAIVECFIRIFIASFLRDIFEDFEKMNDHEPLQ